MSRFIKIIRTILDIVSIVVLVLMTIFSIFTFGYLLSLPIILHGTNHETLGIMLGIFYMLFSVIWFTKRWKETGNEQID